MQDEMHILHHAPIVLILLLASIAFAVPYGAVPPLRSSWKVVALYTGSMMICFPSLYVFGQYLHSKWTLTQTVVLSLVITTVASIFSFSFFPIVWFISYTTDPTSASSIVLPISGILLTASFLLGIAQMARCVAALRGLTDAHRHLALVFAWVALLAFITFRMACHVGAISW